MAQANVEDLGEGIREGGEAFAKSLFRGVTGIVTKPFEGAQKSGVEGFLQGVGKGVIGVGVQPLSGVLDLLSKTTEGANAMRMKLSAAISFEQQVLRRRLPRVIGGDNVLRPYDEYKARGQVCLIFLFSSVKFMCSRLETISVPGCITLLQLHQDDVVYYFFLRC